MNTAHFQLEIQLIGCLSMNASSDWKVYSISFNSAFTVAIILHFFSHEPTTARKRLIGKYFYSINVTDK
ncbi:unnamed protein product [Rotaria socialis]